MEKGHNWGQAPALLSHLPRGAARGRSECQHQRPLRTGARSVCPRGSSLTSEPCASQPWRSRACGAGLQPGGHPWSCAAVEGDAPRVLGLGGGGRLCGTCSFQEEDARGLARQACRGHFPLCSLSRTETPLANHVRLGWVQSSARHFPSVGPEAGPVPPSNVLGFGGSFRNFPRAPCLSVPATRHTSLASGPRSRWGVSGVLAWSMARQSWPRSR